MPVREIPSNLSSSALVVHTLRRYLKLVRVDCRVPSIAAIFTFLFRSSRESCGLITTSSRLQRPPLSLNIASPPYTICINTSSYRAPDCRIPFGSDRSVSHAGITLAPCSCCINVQVNQVRF